MTVRVTEHRLIPSGGPFGIRAVHMPDECLVCDALDGQSLCYFPERWTAGRAVYRCVKGHAWSCWWGHGRSGVRGGDEPHHLDPVREGLCVRCRTEVLYAPAEDGHDCVLLCGRCNGTTTAEARRPGRCSECGRKLHDPLSVAASHGPTCSRRVLAATR